MAGPMYCENSEFNTGDIQLCITWVEAIGILSVKTMGALLFVFAERIQDKIVGKHQGYASTTMYCNLCDCFGFWHICGVA